LEINRKEIKKEAKKALAEPNALIKLIFAVFFAAAVYIAPKLCEAVIRNLIPTLPSPIVELVFDVIGILALAPVFFGMFRLASMISAGNDAKITEMFYYYEPKKYTRALAAYAVTALPIMLYGYFSAYVIRLSEALSIFYMLAAYIVLLLVAAILFLAYCRLYSVPAAVVCGEGQPLKTCFFAAFSATERKSARIYAFRASFILWIALSFLTVGMLFVIFTVPYMLISYFYFNATLFGKEPKAKTKTEVTFDER